MELTQDSAALRPTETPRVSVPVAIAEFAVVAVLYFLLAKFGLSLASIHPSASPVWPPTGFALAVMLLRGYRIAPAIFAGALIANALTAGNVFTSIGIGIGNTLEAVVGTFLITRWAAGRNAFGSALCVAMFVLAELVATPISAGIGVGVLAAWGFVSAGDIPDVVQTWWLGDFAGALVIAPVIVLWATQLPRKYDRDALLEGVVIYLLAAVIGVIGFAPYGYFGATRDAAAFLVIIPLMWAALRRGPRDTATVAAALCAFAIWGTYSGTGPFGDLPLNEAFFRLLIFMISVTVPSLALSADVAKRKSTEDELRGTREKLEERVQQRTSALLQEIEQRRRAEEEKEHQRIHLVEAQRLANLGSWIWNGTQNSFHWSDELRRIFGISDDAPSSSFDTFLDRTHPDDRDRLKNIAQQAYRSGHGFRFEHRMIRADGDARILRTSGEIVKDSEGKAVQMLGVCHDITEMREAERKLERTETNYRVILEGIQDYAIFMLDPKGHIMSWNPGAARIKGYEAHEILGKHCSLFYSEDDRRAGIVDKALLVAAKDGKFEHEGLRARKDGSTFWAQTGLTAIRDPKGKLIGFVQITRDITERHESQKKLEETREQLFQSQKMEAIGQLTGGIAHDFNNLLTAILGSASIVERVSGENAQLQRNARNIRYAAERGANLTRQLLSFARRQQLRPEIVDLRQKLPFTAELLAHSLRGNIKVSTHIDADIAPVKIDTGEFDLALLNIAVNAQDAMPEGGNLTIRAHNWLSNSEVGGLKGEFVAIAISDTGAGIPQDVLSRIFEPFFTTKETGKGSGLGLSQVYGFAQQSGGGVDVESREGEGTTVTLYLPVAEGSYAVAAEIENTNENEDNAAATVLLVEDDPDVARTTRETLLQYGYRVHSAFNAATALDMLEKTPSINLIFSDVVMPGAMNGLDLARVIRDRHPELPILLTSGFSDVVTQDGEGEFTLLRKPYQPQDLRHHIEMLLQSRQA